MNALTLSHVKVWLKHHPNPGIRNVFFILKKLRSENLPTPTFYNNLLASLQTLFLSIWSAFTHTFLHLPAFKGKADKVGKRLFLYGGTPQVLGPLKICIGDDCRISGQTTFSGRVSAAQPLLEIGNNVGIAWRTTISVGTRVRIEDNVRVSAGCFLFGYSGHPLDAARRARGEADDPHQIGEIVLRKNVWICTNVIIQCGIEIGEGTVVAAGSVVTHDLPANVLAAGNPAKVIRHLTTSAEEAHHA
ncbi:acyltransferase [Vibrio proteolyticus]|uniref:Acetyltransferase n=1 Tax=Vibrio proteolyticus NBRC 13287 TaxID=1219065 RepID=U3BF52_VIBPR|nr:acyltransferase [Vibrio proteolyticus]GAD65343.1 hypothetical protein VPR01S_01_01150 [Vibrio proteolyticus NBRC 13287]